MKSILKYASPFLALPMAACVGLLGPSLEPGQSTVADVDARLGRVTEVRSLADGEAMRYYSHQPWGYETFAARIGADGRLRTLEQVLTEENVAKLHAGVSRSSEVRELLGPPYTIDAFRRMQREVWSYKLRPTGWKGKDLFVQFSADGVVREIYLMDDDQQFGAG
jgi:hypothetical protein